MKIFRNPRKLLASVFVAILFFSVGISRAHAQGPAPLLTNSLQGELVPVRDPSLIRQGKTYYIFSTDAGRPATEQHLPIRCSEDRVNWTRCGFVFSAMPAWVHGAVPQANNLWAPDISFFHGLYHLYYCASSPGSQLSVIAHATNTTLDRSDPAYKWTDLGPVLSSHPGDDFNAIDANIFIDKDQRVWLTYGSFWSGIKQREIDSATGRLRPEKGAVSSLAYRPDQRVVEGASMLFHGGFYYLFVSYGACCNPDLSRDDYKEAVGRSASVHGPFLGQRGQPLMLGGGTLLLEGNQRWVAPGGGTAWLDAESGQAYLVFHSLDAEHNGRATLWLKNIRWKNGWPVLD